jgi:hypothetical protein
VLDEVGEEEGVVEGQVAGGGVPAEHKHLRGHVLALWFWGGDRREGGRERGRGMNGKIERVFFV